MSAKEVQNRLMLPTNNLPAEQQHFLLEIPWDNEYLKQVPEDFRDFFVFVLPYLHTRTTDVHTAICMGMLDEFMAVFPDANRRVVGTSLILHDVGWSQLSQAEVAQSLGVTGLNLTAEALGPKLKHAVEGEKLAVRLLANYQFQPPLSQEEANTILQAVRYHDQPEMVVNDGEIPIEVNVLVDLDHIWSFTRENFWQDVKRKGVEPKEYALRLGEDLDGYFVTDFGKAKARRMLADRVLELG